MPKRAGNHTSLEKVRIISLPNIVFLYPTMLIGFIAAIGLSSGLGSERTWTLVFTLTFMVNIIVLSFDFARMTTVSVVLFVVALFFGALLLNQRVEFLPALAKTLRDIDPRVNAAFMLMISGILLFVTLIAVINRRFFNYWEVYSNELLHHHGLLGDLERLPAQNVRIEKEIDDIFEWFLFAPFKGSGRLVITPQGQRAPVVLDNVIGIERVETAIKEILSVTEVEINPG